MKEYDTSSYTSAQVLDIMKIVEEHVPLTEERQNYLDELGKLHSGLATVENILIPSIHTKLGSEAVLGRARDTAVAASDLNETAQSILAAVDSLSDAYNKKRQSQLTTTEKEFLNRHFVSPGGRVLKEIKLNNERMRDPSNQAAIDLLVSIDVVAVGRYKDHSKLSLTTSGLEIVKGRLGRLSRIARRTLYSAYSRFLIFGSGVLTAIAGSEAQETIPLLLQNLMSVLSF